jgi:hypothetical protein
MAAKAITGSVACRRRRGEDAVGEGQPRRVGQLGELESLADEHHPTADAGEGPKRDERAGGGRTGDEEVGQRVAADAGRQEAPQRDSLGPGNPSIAGPARW